MIKVSDHADKWCYTGELFFNGVLQAPESFNEHEMIKLAQLKGFNFFDTGFVHITGDTGMSYKDKDFFIQKEGDRYILYRFQTELEKLHYKSMYCNEE